MARRARPHGCTSDDLHEEIIVKSDCRHYTWLHVGHNLDQCDFIWATVGHGCPALGIWATALGAYRTHSVLDHGRQQLLSYVLPLLSYFYVVLFAYIGPQLLLHRCREVHQLTSHARNRCWSGRRHPRANSHRHRPCMAPTPPTKTPCSSRALRVAFHIRATACAGRYKGQGATYQHRCGATWEELGGRQLTRAGVANDLGAYERTFADAGAATTARFGDRG